MILLEPLTIIINKIYTRNLVYFKIKDNTYLNCGTIVGVEINDDLKDNYFIVEGEDTIPFIIYHNWCISNLINSLGMYEEIIKKYHIENSVNADFTIEDICKKASIGVDPLVAQIQLDKVVYTYLVDKIIKKYEKE